MVHHSIGWIASMVRIVKGWTASMVLHSNDFVSSRYDWKCVFSTQIMPSHESGCCRLLCKQAQSAVQGTGGQGLACFGGHGCGPSKLVDLNLVWAWLIWISSFYAKYTVFNWLVWKGLYGIIRSFGSVQKCFYPRQGSKIVFGLRYTDNKVDVHVGTRFEATRVGGFIYFVLDLETARIGGSYKAGI